MGKSRSCSPWLRNATGLYILLIALPLSAMVLLAFAGAWTYPIFTLGVSGSFRGSNVKYQLAAQGYAVNGDLVSNRGWMWKVPDAWPTRIHQVPLLLLFHLITAAFILGVYFFLLLVSMFRSSRRHYKHGAIQDQEIWVWVSGMILALAFLGLAAADVILVFMTADDGFRPDALGYVVIIVGLVVPPLWIWATMSARYLPTEYRVKDDDGHTRRYKREKAGRRPRGDNYFNRMIKG